MSHLMHSATVPFPSLDHLKISRGVTNLTMIPYSYQNNFQLSILNYLAEIYGMLPFLFQEYAVGKKNSAPLVQHISESCTHFPTRNDFNSFTIDYITVSNKYHFIKAMQDTVCVHFPMLYAKWFAQCKMKTSTDGF